MMASVVLADGAAYRVEEPMESWERGSDFGGDGSVHSYPRRDYSQDTRHRAGKAGSAAKHICIAVQKATHGSVAARTAAQEGSCFP